MLDTELPYNPAIPLLGVYSRDMETCPHENLYVKVCNSIIVHNSQGLGTTRLCITSVQRSVIWP